MRQSFSQRKALQNRCTKQGGNEFEGGATEMRTRSKNNFDRMKKDHDDKELKITEPWTLRSAVCWSAKRHGLLCSCFCGRLELEEA